MCLAARPDPSETWPWTRQIKSAKMLCSSGFYSLSRNRQMTVTTRAIVSQVGEEGLYIVRGTLCKNNKGKIFKCG